MTILSNDIKLLESDTMNDADEGGGAVTGTVIVDGLSNNIFEDISTLDRVFGAVHLRKVFAAIITQTVDKYFGSHIIISKLPKDEKLGINLFKTGDWFDRRPVAQSRIENYLAQGARYGGFLWATQFQGSRAISIFQAESAAIPGIGDVLILQSQSTSDEQYVRIKTLDQEVREFTDVSGTFKRTILSIEISDVLNFDFVGNEISRLDDITPDALIFDTVVANAARYYSARPLSLLANNGDLSVKVDTVFSQVVPASQSEVAVLDQTAGGLSQAVVESDAGAVVIVSNADFVANVTIYLGSPFQPGSLSINTGAGTLTDDAGQLKESGTVIGTVSYQEGLLLFGASSPSYTGTNTITFIPAAAPVDLADSSSLAVTNANRGYVWVLNISPSPQPASIKVAYRALGKWYELNDDGSGGIIASDPVIGSGAVDYVSGSVSVTLGVLPDVGSEIIFGWGSPAQYINRASLTAPLLTIKHQLPNGGVLNSSVTVTWNDGTARTATGNADGSWSGDASGGYIDGAAGYFEMVPAIVPLLGTVFTIQYSDSAVTSKNIIPSESAGTATVNLGDTNIQPGTVSLAFLAAYDWQAVTNQGDALLSPTSRAHNLLDDGAGALTGIAGSAIDYATGIVTFPLSAVTARFRFNNISKNVTIISSVVGGSRWGKTEEGYAATLLPVAIAAKYNLGVAGTQPDDSLTLNSIDIDLTYGFAEDIVAGSLRLAYGGETYVERSGQLYHSIDETTGAGTFAGTINLNSGVASITNWLGGGANAGVLQSLLTTVNAYAVDQVVFRTPVAPVKPESFSIRCTPVAGGGEISVTAIADGTILSTEMDGHIEYETGVVNVRFGQWVVAAGNELQPWYNVANVVNGNIFEPKHVYADTIFHNSVGTTFLPLSAEILGLDPVRLPSDGKVPIYAPGDVAVILNDQETTGTYTSSGTLDLGRVRLAKVTVRDSANIPISDTAYAVDLDIGIINWGDLTGISQPLTITDRIEDMAVITDVQITGELGLSSAITHDFPVLNTLVANAVIYGDLFARTSIPFDQQTFTGVWSDQLIGSDTIAQYNNSGFPIVVDNASVIQEDWLITFTSATAFTVTGRHIGQIDTGNTSADTFPINPNTAQPYFTIPLGGWGSGWSAGNVLRFNTFAANVPAWIIQAISQGTETDPDYSFCLEFRGDIDTP